MAKPPKKYSNLDKKKISFIKKKLNITKIQDIDISILKQLKENLKNLKDSRNKNMIIYKLWDVIMCVILASFADNNTWKDIHTFVVDNYSWFKSFLQMTGGIPTEDSYERIMSLIDSNELNKILFDFFTAITINITQNVEILNFDGRVNNGSKRNQTLQNDLVKPLNCLNVYSNKYKYCLYTTQIDDKTNEIPTIENLVKELNLKGIIVTWDALNTQTKNIESVIGAGGDYIVPIKGNQGTFYQDLIDYFDEKKCEQIIAGNSRSEYLMYIEKNHSSIIKYECFQTSDVNWYSKKEDWEKLNSIGMVRKTITQKSAVYNEDKKGKKKKTEKIITIVEKRFYISSRFPNIEEFNEATRKHWSIENEIHWHLDFTFCQDNNTTTNKKALLNLEIIHKFVLAILERVKPEYKMSLRSIRKHLSNNFVEFLPELLCYLMLHG